MSLPSSNESHGPSSSRTPSARRLLAAPEPLSLHREHERAHVESLAWAARMNLVALDAPEGARCARARVAWLAAATLPTASYEQLRVAADTMIWFLLFDDEYVTPALPGGMSALGRVHDRLSRVLRGAPALPDDPPTVRAFADVCARVSAAGGDGFWLERFREDMDAFFESNRWHLRHALDGTVPSLPEYFTMRRLDIALFPALDLAAHFSRIDASGAFFRSPSFELVGATTATQVFLVNDCLGMERELASGERTMNLVFLLERELGISLADAMNRVVDLCNEETRTFRRLVGALPSGDVEIDEHARAYVRACDRWVRGHMDWYGVSGRYALAR